MNDLNSRKTNAIVCKKCERVIEKEGVLMNGFFFHPACVDKKTIAEYSRNNSCGCKTIYMAKND